MKTIQDRLSRYLVNFNFQPAQHSMKMKTDIIGNPLDRGAIGRYDGDAN